MSLRLLVDSAEYWESLRTDLAAARREAFVQALTFEGDSVGLALARLLAACPAPDRRVVVDSFTRHYVNDRWIGKPAWLLPRALRAEVRATRRMFEELRAAGVGVRFVNPFGFLYRRSPARNHKKLALVDGRVAYLGGINFSEHNFAWHDLMLRIEDEEVVAALRADFLATDAGQNRELEADFPGLTLLGFDGFSNPRRFAGVLRLVEQARESVVAQYPYVTPPWNEALGRAAARGVRVRLLLPEHSNWRASRDHAIETAYRHGCEVMLYPRRMSHLKALLVDGRTLVVGSANLDLWSYFFQQELIAIVSAPELVADYTRRVLEPDLRASKRPPAGRVSRWGGWLASRKLELTRRVMLAANRREVPDGRRLDAPAQQPAAGVD